MTTGSDDHAAEKGRRHGGARRDASDRVLLRAEGVEATGWALNQSRGGLRVVLEEAIEAGRQYTVVVDPGGEEQREFAVRVVWVRDAADGQLAGLEFVDP